MVQCPTCHIQFSAGHRVCPICRAFQTPRSERVRYLASETERQIEKGVATAVDQNWLVAEDLSDDQAKTLVRLVQRKLA